MDTEVTETLVETLPRQTLFDSIEYMSKHPEKGDEVYAEIKEKLADIGKIEALIGDDDDRQKETVLHTAVKCLQFKTDHEMNVIELLMEQFPMLILQHRDDTAYAGQTPLHMAVCKGNRLLVEVMLKHLLSGKKKYWKKPLLKRLACGSIFENTAMLGQLPLSIAALTFNKDMFDLLLSHGAELDGRNNNGDTVCHSLIEYGHINPDKIDDVIGMLRHLNEDAAPYDTSKKAVLKRKLRKKIWLMENKKGLNPLQLSVKKGMHDIFMFIIELEAYCSKNTGDGLFDIKIYDVTEIDAIAHVTDPARVKIDNQTRNQSNPTQQPTATSEKYDKSILMMLFNLDPVVAFQFITFLPIQRIVNRKWNAYLRYFYPFWFFHSLFMIFLTWYSVERSQQLSNSPTGYDVTQAPKYSHTIPDSIFVTIYGVVGVIVGILYIVQEFIRLAKGRMPWTFHSLTNPYDNGVFRIMFVVLGLSLIIDFFIAISATTWYENCFLIIAVITGWFLTTFFIRAIKPFSFFTVLIQKIVLGDMGRFFVIIGIEIVAFATAMYMALQGSNEAEKPEYANLWRMFYSMFTLMVGLGDVADFYNTRQPLLCVSIFIGFVVMTTLLMINSLIAMISRTCTELVENVGNIRARDRHYKLQRLSVVLFLESIFCKSQIQIGGKRNIQPRYQNSCNRRRYVARYLFEMKLSKSDDDDKGDDTMATGNWGLKTVVNAIRNAKSRPSSAISDRIRNFFKSDGKRNDNVDAQMNGTRPVLPPSGPGVLDIYQISRCETCNDFEICRN